jgi:hypothetical protein
MKATTDAPGNIGRFFARFACLIVIGFVPNPM